MRYELILTDKAKNSVILTDITKGYRIESIAGLDPPKASISSVSYALTNGSMLTNSKIVQRNIVIDFVLINQISEVEDVRHALYDILKVADKIRVDYSTKKISAYANGVIESFEVDNFKKPCECQLSIICVDPYFYSRKSITAEYNSRISGFQFPLPEGLSVPAKGIPFGYVNEASAVEIFNSGIETGLIAAVEFSGTASYITIHNVYTDEYITVDYDFIEGDILTINTNEMYKRLTLKRQSKTNNIMNGFVDGSSWIILLQGKNSLEVVSDGVQNLTITYSFNTKYLGV